MFRRSPPVLCLARFAPLAVLTALGVTSLSSAAHAEPAGPPLARHVVAVVDGAADAVLEERIVGASDDAEWQKVCTLPCEATVLANPAAEHRIHDGVDRRLVHIGGAEGERVNVHCTRGSKGARVGFIVAGAAGAGAGLIMLSFGALRVLSASGGIGEKCSERSCGTNYDSGVTAGLFVGGAVLALGGTLALFHGVSVGQSKATVGDGDREEEAPPAEPERRPNWRASTWTAPSSPALMVPLVDAHF